ncbi:MAG: alpha/beta hydrolase fold domain-containing protein [Candidatus Limimorpha sp.]
MKKKRGLRLVLIIDALLILAGGVALLLVRNRHDTSEQPVSPTEKPITHDENAEVALWLPVLPAPSVYLGDMDGKEYAVFVETSDEHELKGHYLSLDHDQSDTIAFRLEALSHRIRYQDGQLDKTLKFKTLNVNADSINGRMKTGFFSKMSFQFKPYRKPSYCDHENGRYRSRMFEVEEIPDIPFADVQGYWSELDVSDNALGDQLKMLRNTLEMRKLSLKMDIYEPHGDTLEWRPLVMLIHGGAFYIGTRKSPAVQAWCRHLASLGYVAASIDYRMGFLPSYSGIERAGYRAIQDAHAAMRYLVENQGVYRIDTSMMFIGGSSAGAITSLNLAYMTNSTRPETSRRGFMRDDLGGIESNGNDLRHTFSVKGVVDMWGALSDLTLLENARTPILAFHGDCDDVVPYGYDYPFEAAGRAQKAFFNKMYGSSCIVKRALELGIDARLFTFSGYKHSPHVNADGNLNENFNFIRDTMSAFFKHVLLPQEPALFGEEGYFAVSCPSPVDSLCWKADGGLITKTEEGGAKVVWISNAPQHSISVSGLLPRGIGFTKCKEIHLY